VTREGLPPFKYVICTTKNTPDIPPSLTELIRPAVTPAHTVIVLIQNGLNIEKPMFAAFPTNVILSGVSFCGSHEIGFGTGQIVQEDDDELYVGAFHNPNLNGHVLEDDEAREFCTTYAAGGKCVAEYRPDVGWTRWRKLLYNACLNSICAVTDLDTGRIQLAEGAIDKLVRPAMEEIRSAAKACGHDLPAELIDFMIKLDPITMYNPPSMQVDIRKVSLFHLQINSRLGSWFTRLTSYFD
jgi:2-dehydropantoate 2-reductase